MSEDPFKFSPARLIDSKYMVAEDFGHDGVPLKPRVTIDRVEKEKDGRKWPLIFFKEKWAKPLKLNATSKKALCLMFDPDDYRKWYGKRVDLCILRGDFPQGKKTAVRIWGSPDINRVYEFDVQRFGSREKDRYKLEPTGKNVVLGPGLVRFGRKAGHWGKPFSDFTVEQLAELATYAEQQLATPDAATWNAKVKEDLVVNVREIREEIAARTGPPPEQAEAVEAEQPAEEIPV